MTPLKERYDFESMLEQNKAINRFIDRIQILLDGTNLKDFNIEYLRKTIGVVSQVYFLIRIHFSLHLPHSLTYCIHFIILLPRSPSSSTRQSRRTSNSE